MLIKKKSGESNENNFDLVVPENIFSLILICLSTSEVKRE